LDGVGNPIYDTNGKALLVVSVVFFESPGCRDVIGRVGVLQTGQPQMSNLLGSHIRGYLTNVPTKPDFQNIGSQVDWSLDYSWSGSSPIQEARSTITESNTLNTYRFCYDRAMHKFGNGGGVTYFDGLVGLTLDNDDVFLGQHPLKQSVVGTCSLIQNKKIIASTFIGQGGTYLYRNRPMSWAIKGSYQSMSID
jgi:hypothetical protein